MTSRIIQTSLESLRRRVTSSVKATRTESIPIEHARGRVLAEQIQSRSSYPAQNRSAMDGFALHSGDSKDVTNRRPLALPIVGTIAAGNSRSARLRRSTAVRIMTGAPLPPGANCVVRVEDVTVQDDTVFITRQYKAWHDVRRRGTDIRKGQRVLWQGTTIGPSQMAMLALLDRPKVNVHMRPRVGILSTGDELGPVGKVRPYGHIPDSNRYGLLGLVESAGCIPIDGGRCGDHPESLLRHLRKLSKRCDFIVTSGGVSAGECDVVKMLFREIGGVNLYRLPMKPGRPQAFGHIDDVPFFGLPGNPVSSMVVFDMLVRPALRKMAGSKNTGMLSFDAKATEDFSRKSRQWEFPRVIATQDSVGAWMVRPTASQRSSDLKSMTDADGYVVIPPNTRAIHRGDQVTFIPFPL